MWIRNPPGPIPSRVSPCNVKFPRTENVSRNCINLPMPRRKKQICTFSIQYLKLELLLLISGHLSYHHHAEMLQEPVLKGPQLSLVTTHGHTVESVDFGTVVHKLRPIVHFLYQQFKLLLWTPQLVVNAFHVFDHWNY